MNGGSHSPAVIQLRASPATCPASAAANLHVCHTLAGVDAEDTPLAPLIKCIHFSRHRPRHCPYLGSIQIDWQDKHEVEANLGRHRDAGAPDIAIQRGLAIPRNCYSSYHLVVPSRENNIRKIIPSRSPLNCFAVPYWTTDPSLRTTGLNKII